jgi:hypothetical protein
MQAVLRRLRFLGQSLRRHGPAHVIEVFRQAAVRRRYARSPLPAPTREQFLAAHGATDPSSLLESFARSSARRLPLTHAQRKEFFVGLLERSQGYDAILEEAERFSEGRFLALGIATNEPDAAYDWHRDYGSGRIWEKTSFDTVTFMSGDGADVKFPWELSRCYWIAWLGKAYWISGNGAWSREFVRQIDAWSAENPVNIGVNWSMPMEVGIRAFWLTMGFGLFYGAPGISPEWWVDYLRLAWAHGAYLEHNLEYFSNLTNHYIANCFGLVATGVLLADSDAGKRWIVEGRRRLEAEIGHQVLADGAHYERSLPYHRLVLEMYLVALILLERAGQPFSSDTRQAIERMSELLCDVMTPDGTVPQLGDADDGVILRTSQDRDPYDARDVAAIAAAVFMRSDMRAAAGAFTQGAVLMLGGAGFETFEKLPSANRASSRLYRDGGFAILRSNRLHVVADVGVIGLHGNNDALSFVLSDSVGPIVVDPGTYCYTRSERLRNELRSTAAHNAPSIDGAEIAAFDGLWRVRREITPPRIVEWRADGATTTLEAAHDAYRAIGVTVSRRIALDAATLIVTDEIRGTREHTMTTRFTLHHGVSAHRRDDGTIEVRRNGVSVGHLECSMPLSVHRGWYSPSYGVAAAADTIELQKRGVPPMRIEYIWRLSTP